MTDKSLHPVSADGPSNAAIFVWLFAISSSWHYTSSATDIINYWFRYDALITPLIFLSISTALIGACAPNRIGALLLFAVGQLVAIALRFPFVADHRVMELLLNLSIVLTYGYLAWRGKSLKVGTSELFELYSPIGRWMLLIMYFYGTFHKLNAGFLSVESSCAISFLNGFPLPESVLEQPWIQYAAIYGTLIAEFAAMLLLLSTRTKYYGMLLGMSFHFLVGISSYGTLAHFSAFALALHALFLPSSFGKRVCADPLVPHFLKHVRGFKITTILFIVLQVLLALHLGMTHQGHLLSVMFAMFGVALLLLVFRHGQMRPEDAPYQLRSSCALANLLPVCFFLHCLSPYIGLGTGGIVAMFSGLRTEGGVSNHYIITKPIHLFHYQDKVVYIEESENATLQGASKNKLGLVMFDFQRHFMTRETLVLPLKVRVGDVTYFMNDQESFLKFANDNFTEQSWLERHYLSFRLVDDPHPIHCRH